METFSCGFTMSAKRGHSDDSPLTPRQTNSLPENHKRIKTVDQAPEIGWKARGPDQERSNTHFFRCHNNGKSTREKEEEMKDCDSEPQALFFHRFF